MSDNYVIVVHRVVDSTCGECGGKGFVPHRHITNKRNKRICPECGGKGERERIYRIPVKKGGK